MEEVVELVSDLPEPKSFKWKNYESMKVNGKNKLKCKKCEKTFSDKSGSKALKYHFETHLISNNTQQISEFFKKSLEEKTFEDYLIDFIADGKHSFRIVEEKSFIAMINSLNKNAKIPTRQTIKTKISKKVSKKEIEIENELNKSVSRVSLTTDIWSSISNDTYMSLTAHFIDEKMKIQNILLDFSLIPHPHSGDEIAEKIKLTLNKFKIEDKIMAVTSDNATNNVNAMLNFTFPHFRCFAHIMHLSVTNGLKNFKNELETLRSFVSKTRNSSKKTQEFKNLCQLLKVQFSKPKIDVIIRWNSTLEMIEWGLEFRDVINYAISKIDEFKMFRFTENDWKIFENLKKILEPFKSATQVISGSEYVTSSIIILLFDNILIPNLISLESQNPKILGMRNLMVEKLKKYEPYLKNDAAVLSTVFDPRFKLSNFDDDEELKKKAKNLFSNAYEKIRAESPNIERNETEKILSKLNFSKNKKFLDK